MRFPPVLGPFFSLVFYFLHPIHTYRTRKLLPFISIRVISRPIDDRVLRLSENREYFFFILLVFIIPAAAVQLEDGVLFAILSRITVHIIIIITFIIEIQFRTFLVSSRRQTVLGLGLCVTLVNPPYNWVRIIFQRPGANTMFFPERIQPRNSRLKACARSTDYQIIHSIFFFLSTFL